MLYVEHSLSLPVLLFLMLMLIFVWNLKGKVCVTGGERKQWETFCACTACVPAAFRNSRVIMSKSLLFWATTSQNPIHKFLKYHYKNSLYFFFSFLFLFSSIADLNLRHASNPERHLWTIYECFKHEGGYMCALFVLHFPLAV